MGRVFILPVVLSERRDPRGSTKLGSTISQFSRIVHEQRGSGPYRGHIELSLMRLECGALHRDIVVHCSAYDSNDPQRRKGLLHGNDSVNCFASLRGICKRKDGLPFFPCGGGLDLHCCKGLWPRRFVDSQNMLIVQLHFSFPIVVD